MLMAEVKAGGGGVTVWGMFSWHTLGPLIPIEQRFHALKNSEVFNLVPNKLATLCVFVCVRVEPPPVVYM
jgi:hypothetical protein